jgi:hypothetical protein
MILFFVKIIVTHVDPLNFVSIEGLSHKALFVSMKTCLSVEYNVSLWDIYLFVFFKAVFKFLGRFDTKNLLTS